MDWFGYLDCFGNFPSSKERGFYDKEEKFMTCIIRVDKKRSRWLRSLMRLLRTVKDQRSCQMIGNLVQVSGTIVPEAFTRASGRAKRTLTMEYIHYGQCSNFLFGPDLKQYQKKEPAPPPPVAAATSAAPDDSTCDRDNAYPICSAFNTGFPPALHQGNLQRGPLQYGNYNSYNMM